jgi:hypothetical protein
MIYHLWQDLTKFSCEQNMNLRIFRHPSIVLVIRISYRVWQFFWKAYKILLSVDSFILVVLLFVLVTQTPYLIHRRAHPFVGHLEHQFSILYIFFILVPPMCQTQWYSLLAICMILCYWDHTLRSNLYFNSHIVTNINFKTCIKTYTRHYCLAQICNYKTIKIWAYQHESNTREYISSLFKIDQCFFLYSSNVIKCWETYFLYVVWNMWNKGFFLMLCINKKLRKYFIKFRNIIVIFS